jgi:hypothetical protein
MIRNSILWRQASSGTALLCLALLPAGDGRCRAADPPPLEAPAPPANVQVFPDGTVIVEDEAPERPQPAPVKPPAKRITLAELITNVFVGDRKAEQRRAQAIQDQQRRALEAQFRPQFKQSLYIELAFLRRACKPDAKVFVDVAKAANAELHVPLRKYVAMISTRPDATTDDPRTAMQKLLMPLAEAKLGAEKARLYRQECDKRTEARKHATVVNLVAVLDERLVLTSGQRAKLVESLSAKYNKSWEQYCEMNGDFSQFLPSIPEQSIIPLLSRQQKSAWQETLKQNGEGLVDDLEFGFADVGESAEIQEIAKMVEDGKHGR